MLNYSTVSPHHLPKAVCPEIELYDVSKIRPHEEIDLNYAIELAKKIATSWVFTTPVIVDRKHGILLDGHHRLHAMRNILKAARIPAVVIDYDDIEVAQVGSWRENVCVKKQDVINAGLNGPLMPKKTSKHTFFFTVENVSTQIYDLQ
ncbi:MAG: ParB N-terminal domain-containing protein [Pseudoruegeria sp.]